MFAERRYILGNVAIRADNVVVVYADGKLQSSEPGQGSLISSFEIDRDWSSGFDGSVRISADGRYAYVISEAGTVRVLDAATAELLATYHAEGPIRGAVSGDGLVFIAADSMGKTHLLRLIRDSHRVIHSTME